MSNLPKPVNTEEEYLHAIALRVDALCNMMDSFIKEYAKQNQTATTKNTTKSKTTPKSTAKKKVKKDESKATKA